MLAVIADYVSFSYFNTEVKAIQKREQPNVPSFAASIPSAYNNIQDVVVLP